MTANHIQLESARGISTTTPGDLPLTDLVEQINAEFRITKHHAQSAVEHAIRMGELLVEARTRVRHGEWYGWLAENFEGTPRHAQNFMRLYRERHKLNAKRVADFTIREAITEVSEPKAELSKPKNLGEPTELVTPKQKPYYLMTPEERQRFDTSRRYTIEFDRWEDWRDYALKTYDESVAEAAAFWRERCLHRLADIDMALDWHKECRPRYRKPTPGAIKAERAWERKRRRIQAIRRYWNRQRFTVEDIVRPVDLGGASPREWGYLLHFLTGEESIKSLQTLRDEGVLRLMGGIADEEERREANAALHKARKRAERKRPAKPREWR